MDNILKLILIGSGVILTCVVVGVGFYISSESKYMSTSGMNQIGGMNEGFKDVGLAFYEEICISGAEVISIMKKYKEEPLFMRVKTKACTSVYGVYYNCNYSDNEFQEAGSYNAEIVSKEDYINTMEQFKCSIYKNDVDVIIGVVFVQQ